MQTIGYGAFHSIGALLSVGVGGAPAHGAAQLVVRLHVLMHPGAMIQGKAVQPRIVRVLGELVGAGAILRYYVSR